MLPLGSGVKLSAASVLASTTTLTIPRTTEDTIDYICIARN
jgi:hypothetical protein